MKKYNVAIIGLGVGKKVLISLKKNKKIDKIKLFDFDTQKLKSISKKFNLDYYKRETDLYNDINIDIIYIASYDNYHFDQCKKALLANKHVFIEKPAFMNEHECNRIKKILDKKKKLAIFSNVILRKSKRFNYLKKKIESGFLGKIYYVEGDYNYGRLNKLTNGWRGKIPYYSVTLGGGIHLIDLICWLLNIKIEEVSSYSNKICTNGTKFKYPDLVTTIFKTKKQIVGKITSNFGAVYPHFHKLSLYGTKKTFENFLEKANFFIKRDTNKKINVKIPYVVKNKGALFNDIFNCIENFKTRNDTKKEIFNVLKVCFAIEKSINSKNKIKLKYKN